MIAARAISPEKRGASPGAPDAGSLATGCARRRRTERDAAGDRRRRLSAGRRGRTCRGNGNEREQADAPIGGKCVSASAAGRRSRGLSVVAGPASEDHCGRPGRAGASDRCARASGPPRRADPLRRAGGGPSSDFGRRRAPRPGAARSRSISGPVPCRADGRSPSPRPRPRGRSVASMAQDTPGRCAA